MPTACKFCRLRQAQSAGAMRGKYPVVGACIGCAKRIVAGEPLEPKEKPPRAAKPERDLETLHVKSVNRWNATAIMPRTLAEPSRSWWVNADRETFNAYIADSEAARMNRSRLAQIQNPVSANK